jgi:hypothetical protein
MRRIVVATLLCVFFAVPLVVSAGDDVDYSAPYLVVEDGELVTKYPAGEHNGESAETDVPAGETIDSSATQVDTRKNTRVAGVVVIAVVAALIMIRRRRQQLKESSD